MKALTICQPYAHLIITPQAEMPEGETQKRVENRTWATDHRGPLLIHAGKTRDWLEDDSLALFPNMVFGAIVGEVDLVDCVWIGGPITRHNVGAETRKRHPWFADHIHTEGPWCWILERPRRFVRPFPYRGQRKLFDVPDDILCDVTSSAWLSG